MVGCCGNMAPVYEGELGAAAAAHVAAVPGSARALSLDRSRAIAATRSVMMTRAYSVQGIDLKLLPLRYK